LSYNFDRNMVGGDIGGLQGLATKLAVYSPQMQSVVDDLNKQVSRLVHDAGWFGGAADSFKRQWERDAVGADLLRQVVLAIAGVVGDLGTNLRRIENALQQASEDARAEGVPVADTGELLDLPPDADPSVIQAATIYYDTRQYALDLARRARLNATAQLQGVESIIGPPPNGSHPTMHPDAWVTAADTMAAFYAVPESARRYLLADRIPMLRAERDAAHARFSAEMKSSSRQHIKMPNDIKQERRATLDALMKANNDLDKVERWDNKLMKFLDTRAGDLAPALRTAAGDSRLLRLASDIPVVDVAATVIATGLASYDDMEKGDDLSAVPKELSTNLVAIAAGAVVATVVIGVVVAIGAPVLLAVGVGVVLGGIVAVGVGDIVSNAWHEHWDEDIHKYGVAGGIGHGLENVASKTYQDGANLVNTVKSGVGGFVGGAATGIWHGIFG
jgi:uncharacterized protein YukE